MRDFGYRVRRRCTGRDLPAHLRRILLMAQQVWSVHAPAKGSEMALARRVAGRDCSRPGSDR